MSKFDPYKHIGLTVNPDGTITRSLKTLSTDANPEPAPGTATVSKDITLDPEKRTFARIFRPTRLPSNDNTVARLPVVIYFHHGHFIFLGPDDPNSHNRCSQIAADIPSIVVSASYRHAPEARLPMQYHDGVDAVLWVKKQMNDPNGEQWVKEYGDPSRCYIYGCDAGANIAFNVSMQAADMDLEPLRIRGMVLNQPMFGGEKRTSSELKHATDQILPLPVLDLIWELVLPKETDRNHRYCNPMVKGPHVENLKKLGKCLVIGYNGDIMVDRQQQFVTMLVKCGVNVEARFDQVGFHNIDMVDPARASAIISIAKDFILG